MNNGLNALQPYPFEKLAKLFAGVTPAVDKTPINLSIGEPKHPTPALILDSLRDNLAGAASYPTTRGIAALRQAITGWLRQRFELDNTELDSERHVLPVNGTREALFAFAQCVVNDLIPDARVLLPNPFYQIYEGAALLAGAEPQYLNCTADTGFIPDFDQVSADDWQRCQLLYVCSPGNPAGAVIDLATYEKLFALADEYDFIIAADECYSEIYAPESTPPLGMLAAAAKLGRNDFSRAMVFHSLSKRSNAPGIRSGFVAGEAKLIAEFLRYRTYHGCAMAPYTQAASIAAWQDEAHVQDNRRLYSEKFDHMLEILTPVMQVKAPAAGFYLWPQTPVADTDFARELYRQHNVTVLPGSYLSREIDGINPGANHIRIALVAPVAECIEAADRIRDLVESL